MLGAFIAERCELAGEVTTSAFRAAYEAFCGGLGERPLSASALGKRLAKRGITRGGHARSAYVGVSLGGGAG